MKIGLRTLDYLFVLRPVLFLPVWTVFLAGYYTQGRKVTPMSDGIQAATPSGDRWLLLGVLAGLTAMMGGVFILNQLADVQTDRHNNKLFLIAHGYIPKPYALLEAILCVGLAFVVSYWVQVTLAWLFIVTFAVTGIGYSFKPLVWKDRPLAGLLTNACGALLIFSIGWQVSGQLSMATVHHAIPYVLAVAAVYLYTTLPDAAGDRDMGKKTFGVRYGFRATTLVGLLLEGAAGVAAIVVQDWVILIPAALSFPLFVRATVKQKLSDVVLAVKWPIAFLALGVGVHYPAYLLVLGLLYVFSRWYYRRRFGLRYPTLVT